MKKFLCKQPNDRKEQWELSSKKQVTDYKKLNILGSIRAKYLVTFALLISVVVLLISIIISSSIMNFVSSTRYVAVDESSKLLGTIISEISEFSDKDFDSVIEKYPDKIIAATENISSMNDVAVVITDRIGNVKYSVIPEALQNGANLVLPAEALRRFSAEDTSSALKLSDIYGFYKSECINSGYAVKDENGIVDGIVIVSAPLSAVEEFTGDIIHTLVMSFIWISLAAVIISIFISERIVSPLKTMEKAAKGVSVGNFDIKVPENGVDNEVADLAIAFNEMVRVVKEKQISQRSFLGSVSHDMRTPMTSIAGFVDGILDGTIPKDKQEQYLRIVSAETHRLSRLVSSLLDLTRIQSGERKFNKTEFDICELLRLVLISMEKQIDDKNIVIEFEPDDDKCTVYADSDGIHQVAYNLIHNAIKFTDNGGLIRISVEKYEKNKYLVSVYNTGKGMKKEELPYVFDRFYKTDPSRGLDKSGVGLGLFIVKTILSSHGEKVWAESEEDKYSCFRFTLDEKGKKQDYDTKKHLSDKDNA